ncbi:MAG TPA: 3-keto-5-aminohexanoate cleavage protein [Streptosporangiaceae bacterium]|nr:3-keto-5-aminohexanoate cleavage protein [Streptosporangiaceae bacterium]
MADRVRRIKACLNGRRTPADHPAVPITPGQLALAAAAAVAAGAEAVHLHPRGPEGRESLRAADVGAAVGAVRAACPGTPIGVTTGLWAAADVWTRRDEVMGWADLEPAQRPDFASLNVSEDGWQELAVILADAGIGAEAGVWSVADAEATVGFDPSAGWLRVMVEIAGATAATATMRADEILDTLYAARMTAPILLHGENESCWPLVAHAGRLGLATRIGLEDVLTGPDGRDVPGNAELVRLALVEWTAAPSG